MKIEGRPDLFRPNGRSGLTVDPPCRIGHARRCARVEIEIPVCLGEKAEIESSFIGMGSFIGRETRIRRTTEIGRFATIGEKCSIGAACPTPEGAISTSYPVLEKDLSWYKDFLSVRRDWGTKRKRGYTKIGNDVFVGEGSIICEGIQVKDGAFIFPGSCVQEDVPAYAVVRGNPAVVTGFRFSEEQIEILEKIRWWESGIDLLNLVDPEQGTFTSLLLKLAEEKQRSKKSEKGENCFLFLHEKGLAKIYRCENGRRQLVRCLPAI